MDEKIKTTIGELLQLCQLPQLQQDLDNVFLEEKNFSEFHNLLKFNLPMLYEAVQQSGNRIFTKDDVEWREIFTNLIMVLCEVTAPGAIFSLPDEHLVNAAENLLERLILTEEIVQQIFTTYQRKLQKNTWKTQLGAIHGFIQFLKKRYSSMNQKMSVHEMNFSLSVALNIRECFDVVYKQMGIQIFCIILNNTPAADIKTVNIHEVIYESVFKDVHYMDSVKGTQAIWECLMQCLKFCNVDSTKWSRADDMVESLLRDIPISPNAEISHCMLSFVTKLGYYFSSNQEEILRKSTQILHNQENVNAMRIFCEHNNSYLVYRWAKNLLQLLVIEAYKLKQNSQLCCQMLQEIHCCFLVYIWPLPLPVIALELRKFYEKYILLLREVFLVFKSEPSIVQLIQQLIQTFNKKFLDSTYESTKNDYADVIVAFEALFQAEFFL